MSASSNKNPPAPQQPLNSTREIKQVRNATLDDLFAILKELFSLKYQQLVDPSYNYKIQLRNISNSAVDLRAAFDYNTIYDLYQKISDDPAAVRYYLFPADILNIAVEAMEIVADEATKRISTKGDSSQLSTLLDEIAQRHSGDLQKAKAIRSLWRGYPQITHAQEHDFAVKQRSEGFKLLSQLTSSAFEHHKQLRGLFDRAYLEQVAGSKDASLKPDYSEFAKNDQLASVVLANGQTVEQVAEGEGLEATTTEIPKEVVEQVPEDIKTTTSILSEAAEKNLKDEQQLVTKAEESLDKYQAARRAVANQTAQIVTQLFFTNYTLTNNSSTLLEMSQVDEQIQKTLLSNLAPQIEKFLENLTPSQLMALVDNREGASTIRLKLFRQTHEFVLGSPHLHYLMQSAIDLHYQSLADNPTAQKALAEKIKTTTHRDVFESLEATAKKKESLELDSQLESVYDILEEKNAWHYGGEQELLRRLKAAGVELESHELIALNELFASMVVSSPQMSADFFKFLDRSRMNLFLASKISPETSKKQIEQLQNLLARYFEVYRAKANNQHQSLQQLSTNFPDQQPTQEGVDKTLEIASHFRKDFIQRTGVTHDEAVALLAGEVVEDDPKLASLSGEVQDQLEGGAWVGMPLGHKIEFLRRSGLGEKILKSIQDDFTAQEVLKDYNIKLDIFEMYQVQMEAAQQIAVAQLQTKQLFATATLSEFQTQQEIQQVQAMMMANRFFVPGEDLSGIDPSYGAYLPTQDASQAVAGSEQLGQHAGDQRNQMLEGLASKGVAAALVAAGVPAPAANVMAGIITSQLIQQAQQIQEILKKIIPAIMAAMAALLALIGKFITTVGTVAASALLAGGGFALLGPPGLLLGGVPLVVNALSGAATTTGSAVGSSAANQLTRATQAARPSLADASANFKSATSDLLGNIASKIKSAFSKEALGNTLGIGATSSGPLATTLTASATAVPMVTAMLTMTVIASSFLIDPLYQGEPLYSQAENQFLTINKTVSPPHIPNHTPSAVIYQIEITPRDNYKILIDKSTLSDSFSAIGESSSPLPNFTQEIISQIPDDYFSESLSISYQLNDVSGEDILIINRISFSFEAADITTLQQQDSNISASTSLRIGNPVLGCFNFADGGIQFPVNAKAGSVRVTSRPWLENERIMVYEAFAVRAATNSSFISLLCKNNEVINLYRLPGTEYGGWAPSIDGGNSVGLYDGVFGRSLTLEYTLLHELGHIIDYRSGSRLNREFGRVLQNSTCFTYPFPALCEKARLSESFAEAVTLYIGYKHFTFSALNGNTYNFPSNDPTEYNWMRNNIFGGEEF